MKSVYSMIDEVAVDEYLRNGFITDNKTFVKDKRFVFRNIGPVTFDRQPSISLSDVRDALENYFHRYNNKHVAVLLSGGKDSRLIIAVCNSLGIDVTGVTVGYDEKVGEVCVAKRVCNRLGVPHVFMSNDSGLFQMDHIKYTLGFCRDDPSLMPCLNFTYFDMLKDFDAVFDGSYMSYSIREQRFYNTPVSEDECVRLANQVFIKFVDCCMDVINYVVPALHPSILDVLWSIPERDTVVRLLKRFYPETYSIPRGDSIFPIGFPYHFFYGYNIVRNCIRDHMLGLRGGLLSCPDSGEWQGHEHEYYSVIRGLMDKLGMTMERIDRDTVGFIRRKIMVLLWMQMYNDGGG